MHTFINSWMTTIYTRMQKNTRWHQEKVFVLKSANKIRFKSNKTACSAFLFSKNSIWRKVSDAISQFGTLLGVCGFQDGGKQQNTRSEICRGDERLQSKLSAPWSKQIRAALHPRAAAAVVSRFPHRTGRGALAHGAKRRMRSYFYLCRIRRRHALFMNTQHMRE